jgi:HlyD family secretion protein
MPTEQRPLSPELLNQNITLVKAPSWILAVVLLGVMAAALLWGIYGTVLVQITGRGLLVHADNQQVPVLAIERAQLLGVHVAIGDEVKEGQVLFTLDAPSIDVELKVEQQRLRELQKVQQVVSANADKATGEQETISRQQSAALDQQSAQLKAQLDYYSKEVDSRATLLKDGFTTTANVETVRERRDTAALELIQSESRRVQINSDLLLSRMNWQRQQMDAQLAVDQQAAKIEELKEQLDRASRIVARRSGFITEILVSGGQLVPAGSKVASLSTRGPGYQVVAFFQPHDGKRLEPGMSADIVPTTVKREQYGTMEGVVDNASVRPISLDQATEILGNETLARYLTSNDPPIMGRIAVSTASGEPDTFIWRNGLGPPFSVTTGTVADVQVTVQRQVPITLVLPYLKSLAGM